MKSADSNLSTTDWIASSTSGSSPASATLGWYRPVVAAPATVTGPPAGPEGSLPRDEGRSGPGVPASIFALAITAAAAMVIAPSAVVVLVASLGLLVGAIALLRLRVAILLLVATGPLESALPIDEAAVLTPVKAAGALCVLAFVIDAVVHHRRIRFDKVHGVLAALLALALVSSLGARSIPDALATTVRYASFVGLYFVATQGVDDARAGRRGVGTLSTQIAWVLSGTGAIAAVIAVWRFLSGESPLAQPVAGDPNDLAFILATTLPLTLWLVGRTGWPRLVAAVLFVPMAASVVLSLSRSALLALAVAVVWHAATERRHIPALLVGGAVIAGVAVFVVGAAEDQLREGLNQKQFVAAENVSSRLDAWRAASELAADRPLTGVGPGNFGLHYFEQTGRPPGTFGLRVVHDAYLDVAAELGIVGLGLFLAYLGITFARAGAAIGSRPHGLAAAVRAAMVVAIVAAITLSEQYYPPFWVLGAMATMLWLGRSDR